uniref:Chondroitin synthase n=1 Tax=uncultured organism TaxID=155900 RepID=A0A7L9QD68_9ZZZZ|nr:chondroitin synthase [uncultured organism]
MKSPERILRENGRLNGNSDFSPGDSDEAYPRFLAERTENGRLRTELAAAQLLAERLRDQSAHYKHQAQYFASIVRLMQSSKFWGLRNAWFRAKRAVGRGPGPLAIDAGVSDSPVGSDDAYLLWRTKHEPRDSDITRMRRDASALRYTPVISVLMPTYETPEPMLRAAIESVQRQAYPFWELCIADDASPSAYVRDVIDEYCAADSRIKAVFRGETGHISRASNSALELATGEFAGYLDHDDLLTPDALYEVAAAINADPELDMLYSDEDKIDETGRLSEPHFKPDWSPDSILGRNYICHFSVYRRSILNELGGLRPAFDGSQDYDLVLRFSERTNRIGHIPRVLYHWRRHANSSAADPVAKTYAFEAGRRAIDEALQRRGETGSAEPVERAPGSYVVRFTITRPGKVSIIIPTRDHGDDVDRCLTSIFERTVYPDFEVIVVDNGSTNAHDIATFRRWENADPRVRVLRHDVPFNFSNINNFAVSHAKGDYLLFLNNDTEVISVGWLGGMIEWAQRPAIGAVGAKLFYPDDTIQHAGVVIGIGGVAGHSHKYYPREAPGYFSMLCAPVNYTAVTGACLMMRREVFDEIGGFDESLAIAFNDVDLCLRVRQAGYRIVALPNVELYHFESKSRGQDDTAEKARRFIEEQQLMQRRWWVAGMSDPCYSPNLTLVHENFDIRM